jgi:hypothetical protein
MRQNTGKSNENNSAKIRGIMMAAGNLHDIRGAEIGSEKLTKLRYKKGQLNAKRPSILEMGSLCETAIRRDHGARALFRQTHRHREIE